MTAPVPLARLHMPPPEPYTGVDACKTCGGARITGELYQMKLPRVGGVADDQPAVLIVDEVCPDCGGCGHDDDHLGCAGSDHARWRPEDDPEPAGLTRCASCRGRQWIAVLAWPEGGSARDLRVPCGCAELQRV